MAKTHVSGPLVQTGKVNSQSSTRGTAETYELFIPACVCFYVTAAAGAAASTKHKRVGNGEWVVLQGTANTDETWIVGVPIMLPANTTAAAASALETARGPRVLTIEPAYFNPSTSGANLDAIPSVALYRQITLTEGGTLAAGTAVAGTLTETDAEVASNTLIRKPVFTLTTPYVMAEAEQLIAEVTINHAATSDLEFYGTYVSYDVLL